LLTGDVERDIGGEFNGARNGGVHRLYGTREDHSPAIKYKTIKGRGEEQRISNWKNESVVAVQG
jgi:hypothetical protein